MLAINFIYELLYLFIFSLQLQTSHPRTVGYTSDAFSTQNQEHFRAFKVSTRSVVFYRSSRRPVCLKTRQSRRSTSLMTEGSRRVYSSDNSQGALWLKNHKIVDPNLSFLVPSPSPFLPHPLPVNLCYTILIKAKKPLVTMGAHEDQLQDESDTFLIQ